MDIIIDREHLQLFSKMLQDTNNKKKYAVKTPAYYLLAAEWQFTISQEKTEFWYNGPHNK